MSRRMVPIIESSEEEEELEMNSFFHGNFIYIVFLILIVLFIFGGHGFHLNK